jgi:TP901 family phage tail tape measure protein
VFGEVAKLAVDLSLQGNFTSGIGGAQRALGSFNQSVGQVGRGVGQVASGITKLGLLAAGAVAGGLFAAAKAGASFEAQLRTINTIARANAADLGAIGDSIRKIARETGTPLADLTQGYYDLLSAGIKAKDATNVLTAANTLSIGGLSSAAEAVDLLTTAINTYGGDATQAARYADIFAAAVERGKVTASEISASFAQVGPLAAQMGVEIEELAAGFARLTAAGTPAGEAATQMASALTALLKKTPDLEALEKATKKNYAAIAGSEGLNVALQAMRTDAEAAGIELVQLVGRKEALLYILQTTGPNLRAYNEDLAAMGDAAGTASEQMGERQQGLIFQLAKLKANLIDAGLTISAGFLPALTRSVAKLTEALADPSTQQALKDIGISVGKFVEGIDWKGLADNARLAVDTISLGLKTVSALLTPIPDQVKGVGAALLIAFNSPVLGGALKSITGGLGNIVAGLGGIAARGIATKIPGIGSLFAQPVYVVNMPLGGLGGGLPGVGGAAAAGGAGASAAFWGPVALVAAPIALAIARQLSDDPRVTYSGKLGFLPGSQGYQPWVAGKSMPVEITNIEALKPGPKRPQMGPGTFDAPALLASFFGTHGAAAAAFGPDQLKAFRTDPAQAVALFDERIRYLAGAQGAGAGSAQYLSLVSRDIAALKSLLPSASEEQKIAITGEIKILEGILSAKKFTFDQKLIDAIKPGAGTDTDERRVVGIWEDGQAATTAAVDSTHDAIDRTRSAIDYARTTQNPKIDNVRTAIDRMRSAVVTAIAGIQLQVNVSVPDSTYNAPTTGDRGGNGARRP